MTTVNLNQTLFAQLRNQYTTDLGRDITYPLTYILFSNQFTANVQYQIKHQVSLQDFLRALTAGLRSLPQSFTADTSKETLLFENDILRILIAKKPVIPDSTPGHSDSDD